MIERLRGAPARIEEHCRAVPPQVLTFQADGRWQISLRFGRAGIARCAGPAGAGGLDEVLGHHLPCQVRAGQLHDLQRFDL